MSRLQIHGLKQVDKKTFALQRLFLTLMFVSHTLRASRVGL